MACIKSTSDFGNVKANCTIVFSPSFPPAPAAVWPHHPAPSAPHPDGTAALYRTSTSHLPQTSPTHPGTVLQTHTQTKMTISKTKGHTSTLMHTVNMFKYV